MSSEQNEQGFVEYFIQRVEERMADDTPLPFAAARPVDSVLSGFTLNNKERAVLFLAAELKERYLQARSRFAALGPYEPKVMPLAECGDLLGRYKLTMTCFWSAVRFRLHSDARQIYYFKEIGYDQTGQIWYGRAALQGVQDLPLHFDETRFCL